MGFLIILYNVRSYAQCGIAWLRLYQPRQTLPAETELAKPLKPALRMSCCYLLAIFHFIILSNIQKLYNRSAVVVKCGCAGPAGRLFLNYIVLLRNWNSFLQTFTNRIFIFFGKAFGKLKYSQQ
jgi:hypothetical protein